MSSEFSRKAIMPESLQKLVKWRIDAFYVAFSSLSIGVLIIPFPGHFSQTI